MTPSPHPFHNGLRSRSWVKPMSLDGPLDKSLEIAKKKPGDSYVNLIIHHVSSSLVNDFAEFVVRPHYPGNYEFSSAR